MVAFLVSEVAFFSTLIVVYLTFLGKDTVGPTPREALSLPLVIVHHGLPAVEQRDDPPGREDAGGRRPVGLPAWWAATIALGRRLPAGHGLRVVRADHAAPPDDQPQPVRDARIYTLVGFHGLHVTAGWSSCSIVLGLALGRQVTERDRAASSWSRGTGTSWTASGWSSSRWSTCIGR